MLGKTMFAADVRGFVRLSAHLAQQAQHNGDRLACAWFHYPARTELAPHRRYRRGTTRCRWCGYRLPWRMPPC